jgi:type IV pilus assembly protein PilW
MMKSSRISAASSRRSGSYRRSGGFTMVELLVALVVSLIVAVAAISGLILSRQGFTAVDTSAQLRDNARFAVDLVQRIGVQAGFKDVLYATTTRPASTSGTVADPSPAITGFNNALPSSTDPANTVTARSAGTSGYGSDVLVMRFQAAETIPGSGTVDLSMIDCSGQPATAVATGRDNVLTSVIYVDDNRGEPSLMCNTVSNTGVVGTARPIIQGVENFQVLYGTDGVVANTVPSTTGTDSVADRYLRADEMVVSGDTAGTNRNWRRVRSLRIGMVLRGPAVSSADRDPQTYYPFGGAPSSSGGARGSAMSSSSDAGTVFTPTPDGRVRQVVTFSVHLRNDQGL